jgi:hypothetical protein
MYNHLIFSPRHKNIIIKIENIEKYDIWMPTGHTCNVWGDIFCRGGCIVLQGLRVFNLICIYGIERLTFIVHSIYITFPVELYLSTNLKVVASRCICAIVYLLWVNVIII